MQVGERHHRGDAFGEILGFLEKMTSQAVSHIPAAWENLIIAKNIAKIKSVMLENSLHTSICVGIVLKAPDSRPGPNEGGAGLSAHRAELLEYNARSKFDPQQITRQATS